MHAPMVYFYSRHVGLYVGTLYRVAALLVTFITTSWEVKGLQILWNYELARYRNVGAAMHAPMVYLYSRHVGLHVGTLYRVAEKLGTLLVGHHGKQTTCICHGITSWSGTEMWVLLCSLVWCTFTVDMLVPMLTLCTKSQDILVLLLGHHEKQTSCICHSITNWSSTKMWVLLCMLALMVYSNSRHVGS
jgi:hypothetical protein